MRCLQLANDRISMDFLIEGGRTALPASNPGYEDFLSRIQKLYAELINAPQSNLTPYVLHYRSLGAFLLICYLLLPPTSSKFVFYIRYPVFLFISYLQWKVLQECRSPRIAVGYGIGLVSAWSFLWGATLVIFRDARSQLKRIERRGGTEEKERPITADYGNRGTYMSISSLNGDEKLDLRPRNEKKGKTEQSPGERSYPEPSVNSSSDKSTHYVWQSLPPTFFHRLGWVFDLCTNFRGVGWSYQNATLPPPPSSVLSTLHPVFPHSPILPSNPPTRFALLRATFRASIIQYLLIDTVKYLFLQDPYFLSPPSPPSASPFPFPRFSRIAMSLVATYAALSSIFLLSPLFFVGILGRTDTWLYPAYFGTPTEIARKGLAGCWGNWWHQIFRFAFESTGDFLAQGLGKGWERKTGKGGALRVFTAFFLSGFLHACGSYSTIPPTRPFNAFLFFALQPVGILSQRAASGYLREIGWRERIPAWLRGVGNVAVVVAWFSATGRLIADDFSACGIWLFEPVPFSFWRWKWVWGGVWVEWYSGGRYWWQRGWAL